MDSVAWAAFHGVKTLFEAAFFGGSVAGEDVAAYLTSPTSVFDLHKGIAVTFRPWDHQMRQSLFLVKISDEAEMAFNLGLLVGELLAIYMPGTDPIERLDQLATWKTAARANSSQLDLRGVPQATKPAADSI